MSEALYHSAEELVAAKVFAFRKGMERSMSDQVNVSLIRAEAKVSGHEPLIVALGRRYWSAELYKYRGWDVLLEIEPGEAFADVWTTGRQHRLCSVAYIGDAGFEDMDSMRAEAKRLREERTSIVRGQIAEILQVIDQRIERACQRAEPIHPAPRHNRLGNLVRLLRRAWNFGVDDREVGRNEPAQGIDPDLDHIEAILKRGNGLAGHGDHSPTVETGAQRNPAEGAAHRLSETQK